MALAPPFRFDFLVLPRSRRGSCLPVSGSEEQQTPGAAVNALFWKRRPQMADRREDDAQQDRNDDSSSNPIWEFLKFYWLMEFIGLCLRGLVAILAALFASSN